MAKEKVGVVGVQNLILVGGLGLILVPEGDRLGTGNTLQSRDLEGSAGLAQGPGQSQDVGRTPGPGSTGPLLMIVTGERGKDKIFMALRSL